MKCLVHRDIDEAFSFHILSFYNLSWFNISLTCLYHHRMHHLHVFTVTKKATKLESSSNACLYYVNI